MKSIIKLVIRIKIYFISLNKSYFHRFVTKKTPIFIYQMGKVASTSIYQSIHEQYNGACFHAHSFNENNKKKEIRLLYEVFHEKNIPIKIISLVREPISRNISAFFQNFERDTGFDYKNNPYSMEELLQVFLEKFKHHIPLVWFDEHIKLNFKIDVYNRLFPEAGYDIFRYEDTELLVMRHDIEDNQKEKIISTFLEVKDFKLKNTNIGNEKKYAKTYNEFKKISFPKEYIDRMLNSKYVNHFFSKDIDVIRNKWKSH